ncbi:MFS transporter [Methylocystis sp. MJC1]|jgi:CP family cyanate transporter-like MFS transporter|uniref:MFS transporter n=1 Tax=Methylocystis sp. MJC1 TaxID=2654282 RepID=UPI0019D1C852|nr:MFS transporter [Methylocystis sp. MJC1]KAF2989370.1 putative transporter YycB [Methylocystis sp. MJC1]MBU6526879.1 MFS transporter [Methylocystis sp. MJC1]UZX13317.1 MFS transporter [Methylocystis sp. MJC1]
MTAQNDRARDASAWPCPKARAAGNGLILTAIILLALNLRPVMAGLGPLLDLIESSTGLSSAEAGLLTTLPVFLLGLGAFAGGRLRRRFGTKRVIALGIATIALACASRAVWNDAFGMLATAAGAGLGIAVIQALLPGVIKERFGAGVGRAMGLYTTAIMGGAAFAAATASGLARALDWPGALAVWALPAAVATIGWLALPLASQTTAATLNAMSDPLLRKGRAWTLMLFFGIGTGAYTLVLAWLPPYYMSLGQSRDMSGYLLAGLTVAEVLAGLGVSAVIGRFPDRRGPLVAVLLCIFAGLVCLVASPLSLALPAVLLLGLGIGALFPLSLIVTLDHVDDPVRAGELAAFVQGGGYIVASLAPFFAGAVRDRFADLSGAWEAMAVAILLSIAIASRLSSSSYRLLSRD